MRDKCYTHDNEYYYTIIRKNIREYKLAQNLTQQDLADMTEVSRECICDIENESRNKHVTIHTLGRIAAALNVPISNLFENQKLCMH